MDVLTRLACERPLVVGILLFPDVEVLDFAGPFEVFSVASRISAAAVPPFRLVTVAKDRTVTARHGLSVNTAADFTDHPSIDILLVPGGIIAAVMKDATTIAWISRIAGTAVLTASVCTGVFLLAEAGLLDGRRVTTHWEDIPDFRRQFPSSTVLENVPFVDEGTLITSAGISAGIEMSLHLVRRILGEEAATRTAKQMQYRWRD